MSKPPAFRELGLGADSGPQYPGLFQASRTHQALQLCFLKSPRTGKE